MRRLLPLLALTVVAAPLLAADPPKAEPVGKAKGASYAILVACGDYDPNELRPVPFAEKETDEFRQVLLRTGFDDKDVKFLHDKAERRYLPEKRKVADELDVLLGRAGADDTVVVLLNGHGVHFAGDATGYFCPVDAKLSDKTTLLAMDGKGGVFELLKACKAKRKVLLVNACRNDPRADQSLAGDKIKLDDEDADEVPAGIAALYSCKPGERSYYYDPTSERSKGRERSLYMHHLIEAWGKGGKTTIEDVFAAVRTNAAADADALFGRKQNPVVRREYTGAGEWVIGGPGKRDPKVGREDFLKGLGLMDGSGGTYDEKQGLVLLQKAADAGNPLANMYLYFYRNVFSDRDDPRSATIRYDIRTAAQDVVAAADGGDAEAQWLLGAMYSLGIKVKEDREKAVEQLRRASEQGLARAQWELSGRLFDGSGATKDEKEALKWLKKAATGGCVFAQHDLGDKYKLGSKGVPTDDQEAEVWLRKAATAGYASSQYSLAGLYEYGIEDSSGKLKTDVAEAVRWYRKAAEHDDDSPAAASLAKDALKRLGK